MIGNKIIVRSFVSGNLVTQAMHLCIYDTIKREGFFITLTNALDKHKWIDFFGLKNDITQELTTENLTMFLNQLIVGKEKSETCKIKFIRRKKYLGGVRDYTIRIDNEKTYVLSNGRSFEVSVSPGKHLIEITNNEVLSKKASWTGKNVMLKEYCSFDDGDILVLDLTMNECDVKWE